MKTLPGDPSVQYTQHEAVGVEGWSVWFVSVLFTR